MTLARSEQQRLRERYGPCAVVTGASDGIGREIAIGLAQAGLRLVLAARRGDVLDRLAGELTRQHGVDVEVVAGDLGTPDGVATLLERTRDLPVHLFAACAGFGTSGPFLESVIETELEMIDLNCRAVVELTHGFGARFARQGRGGIILMSSLVAFQGVPKAAGYAATKAFVQSFAEGLRHEMAPLGVDVLASAPGPVHSGFARRAAMTMSNALPAAVVAAETLAALGRKGTVRPGWLSKFLEGSLKLLPRSGRVRIMGVVMSGMARRRAQGVARAR